MLCRQNIWLVIIQSHEGNAVVHSSDKQWLMTCPRKAALITKGTFCCQERFGSQKSAGIDFPPFCLFAAQLPGALPACTGQKNCVVYQCLGSVPCSNQLRGGKKKLGGQKKKQKTFLKTICPCVIKAANLLEVLLARFHDGAVSKSWVLALLLVSWWEKFLEL